GGAPGWQVVAIALPLVAAIAEPVERVAGEKILCLGGRRRPSDRRAPVNAADLDDPESRFDAHQRLAPGDPAAGPVDDREEQRIATGLRLFQPGLKVGAALRRAVGQIAEALLSVGNARCLEEP